MEFIFQLTNQNKINWADFLIHNRFSHPQHQLSQYGYGQVPVNVITPTMQAVNRAQSIVNRVIGGGKYLKERNRRHLISIKNVSKG